MPTPATMNYDDIHFASMKPPGILRPAPGDAPVLRSAPQDTNPLKITETEGSSIGARLNLGDGMTLGVPSRNPDGSYIYPVKNSEGDVIGGFNIYRQEDGDLVLSGANQNNHFQSSAEWIRPNVSTGSSTGVGKEKDYLKGETKDLENGYDGVVGGVGGQLQGSANAFEAQQFNMIVEPDGSGLLQKITVTAGKVGGGGKAEGTFDMNGAGILEAKAGVDAGVEGKLAEATLTGEKFWSMKVSPDGTCQQSTLGAEGGGFIGGAAKYNGGVGTEGAYSKGSVGFLAGVTGGGKLEYNKDFQCENPFAKAGEAAADTRAVSSGGAQWFNPGGDGGLLSTGPTYQNWGGGGWNGGVRDDAPVCRLDWLPPHDEMDEAFRLHDYAYIRGGLTADTPNSNPLKQQADLELLENLRKIPDSELDADSLLFKTTTELFFSEKTSGKYPAELVQKLRDMSLSDLSSEEKIAKLASSGMIRGSEAKQFFENLYDGAKEKFNNGLEYLGGKVGGLKDYLFGDEASVGGSGDSAVFNEFASRGFGGASGGSGQSISAMEDQADDLADNCDQHADRAEAASRRARSSARRAAATAARIRAMLSRRRSY